MRGTGQRDECRTKGKQTSWRVWGREVPGPQNRQRCPSPPPQLPQSLTLFLALGRMPMVPKISSPVFTVR